MSMATGGPWIVGVDIGGTNIVVGLVPVEGGGVAGVRILPTLPERGAMDVVGRAARAVREAVEEVSALEEGRGEVIGMGIGSPGPLDRKTGRVLETPNLGWRNLPLRDLLSRAAGLPATLDNDANCATYGEWWRGAGQGARVLVGLTLGTGIGGGLVLNGELQRGVSDVAGEFGHMTIDSTGRRCKCGNYGCLEAYASGPAIASRALEGIRAGIPTLLVDLVEGRLEEVTAATVYEAAVKGDPFAVEVMAETARFLGVGVANLVNALNPDVVVIAGGVTRSGAYLFEPLEREVRRRAFPSAVAACRIVPAGLGELAGVVGAAAVFKREILGSL